MREGLWAAPWGHCAHSSTSSGCGKQHPDPCGATCKMKCGLTLQAEGWQGGLERAGIEAAVIQPSGSFYRFFREEASWLLARGSAEGQAAPWDRGEVTENLLWGGSHLHVATEPPEAAEMAKHGAPACAEPTELLLSLDHGSGRCWETTGQGHNSRAPLAARGLCWVTHCHPGLRSRLSTRDRDCTAGGSVWGAEGQGAWGQK